MRNDINTEIDRRDLSISAISLLNLKTKKNITPSTNEVMVSCPLHGVDKTPSMGIDLKKGIYNCFACGAHGTIESLYRTLTGNSLLKTLGVNSDSFSNYARNPLKVNFYENFEKAELSLKSVYLNYNPKDIISINQSKEGLEYVRGRGISPKVAQSMKMGYVEESRINGTYFKRRLVIPIYENQKLISIEGRRVFREDPDPKVLYPKNCTVNTLYDIDLLDKEEPLYACEGLMDLAVLRGNDFFKNSSAIFGANLTKRQINLFSQFKKVIYINDRDGAGRKTLDIMKDSGLDNLYNLPLPSSINGIEIKDIGDIPKTGASIEDLLNRKWLSYIKKI